MSPSASASLERLFREDSTLLDGLLACLKPSDLVALSRTNRHIYGELRGYFRRAFSVDRVLRPFFVDVSSFRKVQLQTSALISGSTALQLFDRASYSDADLDVYVESRHALTICRYLEGREMYLFVPADWQETTAEDTIDVIPENAGYYGYCANTGVKSVLNFERGNRKVQVIVTSKTPMDAILNFHSTCVMNLITHDAAYSLFPRLTLDKRCSRIFTASPPSEGIKWIGIQEKYTKRGFRFVSKMPRAMRGAVVNRWVGDARTWRVDLTPVLSGGKTSDTMSLHSFQIVWDPLEGSSIEFDVLISPALRSIYTVARTEQAPLCEAWVHQVALIGTQVLGHFDWDTYLCAKLREYRTMPATHPMGPTLIEDTDVPGLCFVEGGRQQCDSPVPISV